MVEIETTPAVPDEVAQVLAASLEDEAVSADPWWQAGIEEALGE